MERWDNIPVGDKLVGWTANLQQTDLSRPCASKLEIIIQLFDRRGDRNIYYPGRLFFAEDHAPATYRNPLALDISTGELGNPV